MEFPILPVGLNTAEMVEAVYIHELVAPLSDNVLKNCKSLGSLEQLES